MAKDYYQTLGVHKTASDEEIRAAYRKAAHQHHPDKTGGDDSRFKEINAAYQVLKDPQKRSQYDQFGQTFDQGRAGGGFQGFDFSGFGEQGGSFQFDLGDLFGQAFGGGGRAGRRSSSGADIEVELTISFRDAVFGTTRQLTLDKQLACAVCSGSGAEPGSTIKTCPTCKGTGQIARNIGFGIAMPVACTECSGRGSNPEKHCKQCKGRGVTRGEKMLNVKIPAGIDDGQSIRITGEGQAAELGGKSGDLYVRVQVVPDPNIKRHGFGTSSQAEISFAQAALGDKIEIETLDGPMTLKIPDGTQSGIKFRLKGKGVPYLGRSGRGDHYVEVLVKTPTQLSRKQRKLLEEFESED